MDSARERPKVRTPQELRRQFRYFLYEPKRWNRPGVDKLQKALRVFREQPWDSYIFGGLLRDLSYYGAYSAFPRDLDIVVNEESVDAIRDAFSKAVNYENQFGGLALDFGGWKVDVWALGETWALKQENSHFRSGKDIAELPKTTFLNVEAVAIELHTPPEGQPRKIYEHEFFQGMNEELIDINFEPNPYPKYCILRTLLVAFRFHFSLSHRLLQYISDHVAEYGVDVLIEGLIDLQRENYGTIRLNHEWLYASLKEIENHLEKTKEPLFLSTIPSRLQEEPDLFNSIEPRGAQRTIEPPY